MIAYLPERSIWIFYRNNQMLEIVVTFKMNYQVLPGTVYVRRLHSDTREQAYRTVWPTKLKSPIIEENTVHLYKDM